MRAVIERIGDRNILVIYGATLLLASGYGVSIALTSLHLDAAHFTKHDIGTLASWFALGIVYFALIGRNRLILSPEEEFALEHANVPAASKA